VVVGRGLWVWVVGCGSWLWVVGCGFEDVGCGFGSWLGRLWFGSWVVVVGRGRVVGLGHGGMVKMVLGISSCGYDLQLTYLRFGSRVSERFISVCRVSGG